MSQPGILVIGAGALGTVMGYHLQLAGADICFLVRPNRLEKMSRPQKLYAYHDHSVKPFSGYRVIADLNVIKRQSFRFVVLTLDGASCRSAEGTALLRELGDALAGTGTKLLICGVGIGLYDHIQTITGFDRNDLLEGTMVMYAYQVDRAEMPLPPPADRARHDMADVAYLNFSRRRGFMVASGPGIGGKDFVDLLNKCEVVRGSTLNGSMFRAFTSAFFAFTTACELTGWQGTEALINNTDIWSLCCTSQREILGLKQHGLAGKLMSWLMSDKVQEKNARKMERDASPMDMTAFNRFHHGNKVLAQDIGVMEDCARAGAAQGRDMSATNALLQGWRQLHKPANPSQKSNAHSVAT